MSAGERRGCGGLACGVNHGRAGGAVASRRHRPANGEAAIGMLFVPQQFVSRYIRTWINNSKVSEEDEKVGLLQTNFFVILSVEVV